MGKIVLEDLNEGDGYYKVNLAYLNNEQVKEIENFVSKWNPTDEDIKSCISMCLTDVNEQKFKDYNTNLKECLVWIKKQGDKDKLIQELGEYKIKYTQEVLEKHINSMSIKDDEKLRKTAIAFLKDFAEQGYENAVECIDWLEKQGEQKPADKVEPKFKVGDWVVWDNKISYHIDNIYQSKESLMYTITSTNNKIYSCSVKGFDKNAHLWTIEDAKDGDVLSAYECIVLFKEIDGLNIKYHYAYHFMNNPNFYVNTLQNKNVFHPATKEQRELLFTKMKEAGYRWDSENKGLKKIEQMGALREEDEYRIKDIIYFLDTAKKHYASTVELDACIDWLKSLRIRSTWKPSKEQIEALDSATENCAYSEYQDCLRELTEQLKKLREE